MGSRWSGLRTISTTTTTTATTPDASSNITYDANHQLVTASATSENYEYDLNGNRESADGSSYVTGDGNRMLFDGTYDYTYDNEGNRTTRIRYQTHADGGWRVLPGRPSRQNLMRRWRQWFGVSLADAGYHVAAPMKRRPERVSWKPGR